MILILIVNYYSFFQHNHRYLCFDALVYDPEEFEMITGETWESAGIKHENWKK